MLPIFFEQRIGSILTKYGFQAGCYPPSGVTIQRRDSRISTKVGHAIREKLGLDIQAQLNKRNGNGNGKKFDWQEWNNTVFPKLVGRPDELKYDVEVVALAMSQIYDTIADNPQAAIADLMEFNAQSLNLGG